MKKPNINPDDRREIDELLSEALNGSRRTDGASIGRFLSAVSAADRAGRDWPDALRDLALWEWTQRQQTAIGKRESVVLIDHGGRKVGKATPAAGIPRHVLREDGRCTTCEDES